MTRPISKARSCTVNEGKVLPISPSIPSSKEPFSAVAAVAADSNDSSRVARVAKRVNDARRDLLRDARAIDRTRDDVFEELALLERRFADAACV